MPLKQNCVICSTILYVSRNKRRLCDNYVCSKCEVTIKISYKQFFQLAYKEQKDNWLFISACKLCKYINFFYNNIYQKNDFFILGHAHNKNNFQAATFTSAFLNYINRYHKNDLENIAVCFEASKWGVKYGCHDSLLQRKEKYKPTLELIKKYSIDEKEKKLRDRASDSYLSQYLDNRSVLSKKEQKEFISAVGAWPQVQNLFDLTLEYKVPILKYDSEDSSSLFLERDSQQYKYSSIHWNAEKKKQYGIDALSDEDFIFDKSNTNKNNKLLASLAIEVARSDANGVLAQNLHYLYKNYDHGKRRKYIVMIGANHITDQHKYSDYFINKHKYSGSCIEPYKSLQHCLSNYKHKVFTTYLYPQSSDTNKDMQLIEPHEMRFPIKNNLLTDIWVHKPMTSRQLIDLPYTNTETLHCYLGKSVNHILKLW